MYLYVTEKIKYYYKIGIAEKLWERLGEYRTLIPDLNCSYEIDLPNNVISGLSEALKVTHFIRDKVSQIYFEDKDVVRHPLVQKIVNAYERLEKSIDSSE